MAKKKKKEERKEMKENQTAETNLESESLLV